jgi:hypothetical protein
MKRKLLLTLSAICILISSDAQTTFEDLKKDLVINTTDKMTLNLYRMVNIEGVDMQIKFYAESPLNGLMSRDHFVNLFFEIYQELLDAKSAVNIVPLDELIGEADETINIYFAHSGMQIASKSGTETNKTTILWKDYFSNN